MEQLKQPWLSGQLILGTLLLLTGVLFLMDNAEIIDIGPVWRYWPLVLIAVGASKFFGSETGKQRVEGAWLAFIGAWLFVSFNHVLGLSFRTSWPILIIAWGVTILWKSMLRPATHHLSSEEYRGQ